jgi:hypothetical protein
MPVSATGGFTLVPRPSVLDFQHTALHGTIDLPKMERYNICKTNTWGGDP